MTQTAPSTATGTPEQPAWQAMDVDDTIARTQTRPEGLANADAALRLATHPTDGIKNGLVILAVVALNTLIGFVQEFKAGKAIEALSRRVPENASVMHGGRRVTVAAANVLANVLVGAIILPVVGLEKWWRRRRAGNEARGSDTRGILQ